MRHEVMDSAGISLYRLEIYKGNTCYRFERYYDNELRSVVELLKSLMHLEIIDNYLIKNGGPQWL